MLVSRVVVVSTMTVVVWVIGAAVVVTLGLGQPGGTFGMHLFFFVLGPGRVFFPERVFFPARVLGPGRVLVLVSVPSLSVIVSVLVLRVPVPRVLVPRVPVPRVPVSRVSVPHVPVPRVPVS